MDVLYSVKTILENCAINNSSLQIGNSNGIYKPIYKVKKIYMFHTHTNTRTHKYNIR